MSPDPRSLDHADDWQLLRGAGEGDDLAGFEVLFDRHKDYVYRLAWGFLGARALAEDVIQEVFLRLARRRRRFLPRAKFRTLLYRVTLSTARELQRRRRRDARYEPALDRRETPPEPRLDPRLGELARALDGLSQRQREVVVLRYYEGLDTRETARVMRCREGTVKAHLHRALGALRRLLERAGPVVEPLARGQPAP